MIEMNNDMIEKKIDELFSMLENTSDEEQADYLKLLDEKRSKLEVERQVDELFLKLENSSEEYRKAFFAAFDEKRKSLYGFEKQIQKEIDEFFDMLGSAPREDRDGFFEFIRKDTERMKEQMNKKSK